MYTQQTKHNVYNFVLGILIIAMVLLVNTISSSHFYFMSHVSWQWASPGNVSCPHSCISSELLIGQFSLLSPVIGHYSHWRPGGQLTQWCLGPILSAERSEKCYPISHRGAIIREKVGDINTAINRSLWPAIRTDTSFQCTSVTSVQCGLQKIADDISMHQYIGPAIVIALL